jgi:peroxiredoxin
MKNLSAILLTAVAVISLSSFKPSGYNIGDAASDFKLKNIDGKMVSLGDYKTAKGFIIVFTCNHCPYANAYVQRIIDLDKQFKSQGYPVIAISSNDASAIPDDSYDKMVAYAKDKGFTFPYLYDESQQVAQSFGAQRTPHVFVLSKTNKGLQVVYEGAIDDNTEDASQVQHHYVQDAVNALLQGKQPAVNSTKAIGCTIKWKS